MRFCILLDIFAYQEISYWSVWLLFQSLKAIRLSPKGEILLDMEKQTQTKFAFSIVS